MASTVIQVNSGSGPKLAGDDYTDGANTVIDQRITPGEYKRASYSVLSGGVATATAASHLLQIMAGASLNVRIRRISIREGTPPAAVTAVEFVVARLTTAGTGGTAITPAKFNPGAAGSGATAMTLPTAKGTEGTFLKDSAAYLGTTAVLSPQPLWYWEQRADVEPIIIAAGTSNGIAIKNVGAVATATLYIEVELVETPY